MQKLSIIGNASPEIGVLQEYSVLELNTHILPQYLSQEEEKLVWDIYVLEKRGWRKTNGNPKIGKQVSYTFTQRSLSRKGIKVVVEQNDKKGELIIKPQPAQKPKILKVELLDINGKKVNKSLNYMDTLVAKAYCADMEGEQVYFTLWEDDAVGKGHHPDNEVNKINPIALPSIVKKGVAEVRFPMAQYYFAAKIANIQSPKGSKDEGMHHEYYVTVEYRGKSTNQNKASNNVNIKNPEYYKNSDDKSKEGKAQHPPSSPSKDTYQVPLKPNSPPKSLDPKGKILKVTFRDKDGNLLERIKRTEGFVARIETQNLQGQTLKLTVWEDDIIADQKVWEEDVKVTKDIVENAIKITQEMWRKGDDFKEFKDQEYYLEVSYSSEIVQSKVVEVKDDVPTTKPNLGKSMSKVAPQEKEQTKKEETKCPNCDKPITTEELKRIFPDASETDRKKVAETYNKYMKDLQMNTCWNKAHFFAQAIVESGTGLKLKEGENFNYYWEVLISTFSSFQSEEGRKKAKEWGRTIQNRNDPQSKDVSIENQIKIANYAYSPPAQKARELGNTDKDDGWTFQGRGLIQVTGKAFYKYCTQYTLKYNNIDVLKNPDIVGTNLEIAVSSAMIFFKWKSINILTNGNRDVKGKICPLVGKNAVKIVNGKTSSNYEEKQKSFDNITSKIFKIDECIYGQENQNDKEKGVLDEMKELVDRHIPYSQLGERASLDEKGLKNLDCSETVGIYLYKLGVMPKLLSIYTGVMTTEKDFRKNIGSDNIDFISGSDKKDFKPQRGDIFVWRRSDGVGHTGIVYEYDEDKDIVTILEAIGSGGAVSEAQQVRNGGYPGKGCSRTAKYGRLGGALYGHKGWIGYFRPKNYTKKL